MNHSISFDQLALGERFGEFGNVVRAHWNGKDVVAKKYSVTANVERELRELKNAHHENIIFLYGISYNNEFVYLVLEYMDGGSLHDLIHCEKQIKYEQAHVINWSLQCARALAYMHAQTPQLVHRNINPHNMYLKNKRRDLKISDFTHARKIATIMTTNIRTPTAYNSPQYMKGEKYTAESDVYSWDITVWEMLSRKEPFENVPDLEICDRVIKGERPLLDALEIQCTNGIKQLMTDCWKPEPNERHSMKYIVDYLEKLPIIVDQLCL